MTWPHSERPGTLVPIVLAPSMVSLDWLTLNMRAPETLGFASLPWLRPEPVRWDDEVSADPRDWRAYVTQPTTIRTAQFGRVCYLCDLKGEKVATIWAEPHNAGMNASGDRWIQVQFSNATLYSGEWVSLFRMFRAMGCEYTAISRVDVACDGLAGGGGDFPAVVAMANDGRARYYGKCEWLQRSHRREVIGAEFGSRASNKFIRAYRKKREMKAKGVKPHITAAWLRAFGFDVWNDPRSEVNRFEVALKGKEVRRYFDGEGSAEWVEGLHGVGQRVDVFASMAPGMFDFRTPAERARDAVPVCEWDWSRVDASACLAEREERNLALTDHTIKTGLRSMFMLAHVTSDASGHEACQRYARAAGPAIVDWFERKRCEWVREFARIESARDPRTMDVLARLREMD